jgi:phospholipid-binding lipoprotein MlaA
MFTNGAKTMAVNSKNNLLLGMTALLLASLALTGCASSNNDTALTETGAIYDPLEESNRKFFAFNQAIDNAVINPIARGYKAALPQPARTSIDNVLRNLKSPTIFANQLLQGDLEGAGTVLVRTSINTLLGIGGIFDVAAYEGIEHEHEDFGQTLATWGVGHGPYMVVPVIGPSSARDYIGFFVDSYADPLRWYAFNVEKEGLYYGKTAVEYVSLRASLMSLLEELENSSIDYYAATRSAYYQRREALTNDQDPNEVNTAQDIPDYDDF